MVDRLLATSAVTALVSTRVYAMTLPQHPTFPAIRVSLIDEPEQYHLRGKERMTRARVQVDCFARKMSGNDPKALATSIATAVNDALTVEGWSVGSPPLVVSGAFQILRRLVFESEELQIVREMRDFRIHSAQT